MSEDSEQAIIVKNLTKSFKIPVDKGQSVKTKVLGRAKNGYKEFTPLNDISFTINKGDFFGIVGRNGSGKSTLLKTIAGIYEPTKGKVEVNGALVPFIELGVGFNPQLTGRDNVYLNAAMLGFDRHEIDEMYDDIVDFAELHDFMEERLQNYSSGMQVRLAFSIAIRAKGSILLLDEVLAVGDSAFQQKCFDYFEQLKRENRTVILVTHSMSNVERFCDRGLLLEGGKVSYIGAPEKVALRYEQLNGAMIKKKQTVAAGKMIEVDTGAVAVTASSVDTSGKRKKAYLGEEDIYVDVNIKSDQDIEDPLIGMTIWDANGGRVANFRTDDRADSVIDLLKKDENTTVRFKIQNIFGSGAYRVQISVKSQDRTIEYFIGRNITDFTIQSNHRFQWSLRPNYSIDIT